MSKTNLLTTIIEQLQKDPFFAQFKFRKSDYTLIYRYKGGFNGVCFERNFGPFGIGHLFVRPIIGIRYDIIVKWFEKFSFRSLSDQRSVYTFVCIANKLGLDGEFYFQHDGSNYDSEFNRLYYLLKKSFCHLYEHYSSLQRAYNTVIPDVLNGKMIHLGGGANWIFENLALCKIVSPENYPKCKEELLKNIEWRKNWPYPDPNILRYPNLNEIFAYLENYDFGNVDINHSYIPPINPINLYSDI